VTSIPPSDNNPTFDTNPIDASLVEEVDSAIEEYGDSPIDQFDKKVDEAFDRVRGTEPADRIIYALTELGDFGLIWVLLAFLRGLRSEKDARAAWRLTALLAAESVIINGIVKNQFKRKRPVVQAPRPHRLRIPLTTSFPSGHSSTAMVAAVLLSQRASKPTRIALFALGGAVALSRVHVKIHHASDVAGGIVIGLGLGAIARKVFPLYPKRSKGK